MYIPGWKIASILVLQLIRGFVSGSVTDSTNAIIPGVQIVLTNKQTNIPRQTVTNELGFYRFVAVEPGDYSVEFSKGGFETHKIDSITVKTAQEVVINQTLALAAATVEISVVDTPGVELAKTTATVDRTFVQREIVELPMQVYNGTRDITRLALLAPTVTRAPSFTEFSANGSFLKLFRRSRSRRCRTLRNSAGRVALSFLPSRARERISITVKAGNIIEATGWSL